MIRALRAAGLLAALAASGEAVSQTYPVRPVRFLVGSPPGSGSDLVSRLLGQKLAERFGQPVVVEQKPGGAGLLANDALVKSAPDGHTMVLLSGAHPAAAVLNRALPYDPVRDFGMVGTVVAYPLVIAVAPGSPIRSFADLLERARAAPGKLTYSMTRGTLVHLLREWINIEAGT
jgi:tripartite-type tricarboxylate transporter receptor subunit TctC